MTTIAVRGLSMASDSCANQDGLYVSSAAKLRRLSSGAILGSAGDSDFRQVVAMLDKVRHPKNLPSRQELALIRLHYNGLLLFPRGQIYMILCREDERDFDSGVGILECNRGFAAVGSGADYALGAMAAGKSVKDAVRIACGLDIKSKLPVYVMSIDIAKKAGGKRAGVSTTL